MDVTNHALNFVLTLPKIPVRLENYERRYKFSKIALPDFRKIRHFFFFLSNNTRSLSICLSHACRFHAMHNFYDLQLLLSFPVIHTFGKTTGLLELARSRNTLKQCKHWVRWIAVSHTSCTSKRSTLMYGNIAAMTITVHKWVFIPTSFIGAYTTATDHFLYHIFSALEQSQLMFVVRLKVSI